MGFVQLRDSGVSEGMLFSRGPPKGGGTEGSPNLEKGGALKGGWPKSARFFHSLITIFFLLFLGGPLGLSCGSPAAFPKEERRKKENSRGKGEKRAKFWAVQRRGVQRRGVRERAVQERGSGLGVRGKGVRTVLGQSVVGFECSGFGLDEACRDSDFGHFRLRPISISASWPKSNWPKSSILDFSFLSFSHSPLLPLHLVFFIA